MHIKDSTFLGIDEHPTDQLNNIIQFLKSDLNKFKEIMKFIENILQKKQQDKEMALNKEKADKEA